jgi:hypothetical protein
VDLPSVASLPRGLDLPLRQICEICGPSSSLTLWFDRAYTRSVNRRIKIA